MTTVRKTLPFLILALWGGAAFAETRALRIRPLGTLAGTLGAEVELKPGEHFFFGPTAHYASGFNSLRDSSQEVWELGLKSGWFFGDSTFSEGWYVSASALAYQTDIRRILASGNPGRLRLWCPGAAIVAGHQWQIGIFGERWNFRAGLGMGYKAPYSTLVQTNAGQEPMSIGKRLDVAMDLTLGWNF